MLSRSVAAGAAGLPAVIVPVGLESSVIELIEMFLSEKGVPPAVTSWAMPLLAASA
jgi:hypothetical protein